VLKRGKEERLTRTEVVLDHTPGDAGALGDPVGAGAVRYEFWALSRFDDVWAAYHDATTFSSAHGVQLETLDAPVEHASMIFMDPPDHDRLRKLVSRAFTPSRIRELEASVTEFVDGYLEQFVGAETFDYVEQFGALVPPMVIGELLGVPAPDRDQLRHWFDDILHHDEHSTGPSERATAAGLATFEYVTAMIAERRRAPCDDLITALLDAELDEGGAARKLDDFEVVSFVLLLAGAGVETVARLLSWAAAATRRSRSTSAEPGYVSCCARLRGRRSGCRRARRSGRPSGRGP
jgi:cytochrome P450